MLRIFTEDHIPAVAALFERIYPDQRWTSQPAYEAYFREMFFNNPWSELELPSWVVEENGRIAGFLGVVPRRMCLRGRPLRVAVSCQFVVDPAKRHSLTALQLAKAYLSGPQDLTIADGANELSRRIWTALGGTAPLLYNLHWTRLLRPAQHLLSVLEGRGKFSSALTLPVRPLSALADALFPRLRPNGFEREAELAEDALQPSAMVTHLPDIMGGNSLRPMYDVRALTWLLEQAARKTRHGTLRARAVLDDERHLIGWYLYYVQAGGVSEVLQVAARDGAFDRVLRRLLADAWRHGATAVRGRLEPRHVQELSDRHCWLRREGPWTLAHSRHADVAAAIEQGDAFLSRLEGEWWLRFLGG
jgi:hypothetical protein